MPSQQAQAVKALGLINRYAQRTGEAWLGQKTIARIMAEKAGREPAKYGDRQVRRYRALLEEDGFLESRQNASHYRTNLYRVTPAGQLVLRAGPQAFARPRRHRERAGQAPGHRPLAVAPPAGAEGGPAGAQAGSPHVRPDAPENVRQAFPPLEGNTPPTPPPGGRGQTLRSQTRSKVPHTETELRDALLALGKPLSLVVDALEQLRQAKLKHGVGSSWRYVNAIVRRVEQEKSERAALEERRREEEAARQRQLMQAASQKCGTHDVADCRECRLKGLEMMRAAMGLRKPVVAAESPSEKPSAGVVLPNRSTADVAAESVGGAVTSDRHDGVLTASKTRSGGAETRAEGVPGVAALETGVTSHAGHGFTDVPRRHGLGAEVPMAVHRANEGTVGELGRSQPRAHRTDGASHGVTLVRDAHQAPLPSLVRFPSGERDEKPFRSVLDIFNANPRKVVTARTNDKPKRENEPVPMTSERDGQGMRNAENVRGFQGLRLLLGGAQAVPDAGHDVGNEAGTGGALQSSGPVRFGDGGDLALNGGHLVPAGPQMGDVAPDGVGVCGEGRQPGRMAPSPESLEVRPVGFSGGFGPGTGGELVGLGVQTRQVHRVTDGGVLDEHKGGGGVSHSGSGCLNVQTFKPLEVHKDHTEDPGARPMGDPEEGERP